MAKFKDIFTKLGFSDTQKLAIIQGMLYSGCFLEAPTTGEKKHLEVVLKFPLPKAWMNYPREPKFDSKELIEILNHEFEGKSEKELFEYLIAITQLKMLGSIDFSKGEHNRIEDRSHELKSASEWQLSTIQALDLLREHSWKAEFGKIRFVFIHAMTEVVVRARLNCLFQNLVHHGSDTVTLYYVTNPRLLFNNEESAARILTNWFIEHNAKNELLRINEAILYGIIQGILKSSPNNWLKNLNALKTEILLGVRSKFGEAVQWPKSKDENSPLYDELAKIESRDLLNNEWPTAENLIEVLLNEFIKKYDYKGDIRLITIPVIGHMDNGKYQIANTTKLLKGFLNSILTTGDKIESLVSLSDNSQTYAAERQLFLTKHVLGKYFKCIPLNDGVDDKVLNFNMIWQQFAKTIYAMKEANCFEHEKELKESREISRAFPDTADVDKKVIMEALKCDIPAFPLTGYTTLIRATRGVDIYPDQLTKTKLLTIDKR